MENISFFIKLPVACDHYLVHISWNHMKANEEEIKESFMKTEPEM